MGLKDYASEHPAAGRGLKPLAEALIPEDVLEECVAGYRDGIGPTTIARYLRDEHDVDIKANTLGSYLKRRVEEDRG